jgi:tetratricopeptide (TPR) repeat protein
MNWPNKGRRGSHWGDAVARKVPYSWLAIDALRAHWFAEVSWHNVADVVREAVRRYAIRVGFGHSMGAYAALRHSIDYQPRSILAFAPQWSIDPQDVRTFDTRYECHFDQHLHDGMSIKPHHVQGNALVFYDPHFPPDKEHASRIRAPNAAAISVPNMRHDVIEVAKGSISMTYLVMRALGATASDYREMARFLNQQKKQNPLYLINLSSKALKRNRATLAQTLATRANEHDPANRRAQLLGIQSCFKQGLIDEVRRRLANLDVAALSKSESMSAARLMTDVGWADRAIQVVNVRNVLDGTDTTHLRTLADIFGALSRPEDAIEALERAMALEPTNPHCIAHLGRVLLKQSSSPCPSASRAASLFAAATKLAPEVATFWKSLAFAHAVTGDADAALAAWDRVEAISGLSGDDIRRIGQLKARAASIPRSAAQKAPKRAS